MEIIADTHTHTIASGHAFSTIKENIAQAKRKSLKFLATTDHTGLMPGTPEEIYFSCQNAYPDEHEDVYLIRGCEVNILGADGRLDLTDRILDKLEWVIASLHDAVLAPVNKEAHTQAWLNVARNPLVDVIGHCGDERFAFDHIPVIKAFAEYGKIVEINAHSFHARPGSPVNCRNIAQLCKQYSVPVVVCSDAHFYANVGNFKAAVDMLEEIDFPEELVLNADYARFAKTLSEKCPRSFR